MQALSGFLRAAMEIIKAHWHFQKEVTEYNNKNFNQKQALNAQKLEIQYETEKKNNEVQILKEQERSRRLQSYLYGAIALVAVLGLIIMYRANRFRMRYALQQEKQLQAESKAGERRTGQAESRTATPGSTTAAIEKEWWRDVLQLEHKNQTLLNIKDKLAEGDKVNMQKILKERNDTR